VTTIPIYDEEFFAALHKVVDEAAEVIVVGGSRYGGNPSSLWGILPERDSGKCAGQTGLGMASGM